MLLNMTTWSLFEALLVYQPEAKRATAAPFNFILNTLKQSTPHLGVFPFFVQPCVANLSAALNTNIEVPRKLLLSCPRPLIGSARARPTPSNRETKERCDSDIQPTTRVQQRPALLCPLDGRVSACQPQASQLCRTC